jgi:hypothetical protein
VGDRAMLLLRMRKGKMGEHRGRRKKKKKKRKEKRLTH